MSLDKKALSMYRQYSRQISLIFLNDTLRKHPAKGLPTLSMSLDFHCLSALAQTCTRSPREIPIGDVGLKPYHLGWIVFLQEDASKLSPPEYGK